MPYVEYPGPDEPIEPILMLPNADDDVTSRYDHVDVSGMGRIKLFRVVHRAPGPRHTPEQVRAMRENEERYYLELSFLRALAQSAADGLGFPAGCARRACRRMNACSGERHEFDWSFPGPWMPPCASTLNRIELVRACIRRYAEQQREERQARAAAASE